VPVGGRSAFVGRCEAPRADVDGAWGKGGSVGCRGDTGFAGQPTLCCSAEAGWALWSEAAGSRRRGADHEEASSVRIDDATSRTCCDAAGDRGSGLADGARRDDRMGSVARAWVGFVKQF
jgi:hypothetical protein